MFDSVQEVSQKLGNCVILYRNSPIRVVEGVNGRTNLGIRYYPLGEPSNLLTVTLNDPELDFKNLGERLGYINLHSIGRNHCKEAVYMMRQPVRRSIQGLHEENVFVSHFNSSINQERFGHITFGAWITERNVESLKNTFLGVYPSIEKITSDFRKDDAYISQAFHRNWCIERDQGKVGPEFKIMYKNIKVGYAETLNKIIVTDRYKHLRDDLKEFKVA